MSQCHRGAAPDIFHNYVQVCEGLFGFHQRPHTKQTRWPDEIRHVCVTVLHGSSCYCSTRPQHGGAGPDWATVGKHLRFRYSLSPRQEWVRAAEFRFSGKTDTMGWESRGEKRWESTVMEAECHTLPLELPVMARHSKHTERQRLQPWLKSFTLVIKNILILKFNCSSERS